MMINTVASQPLAGGGPGSKGLKDALKKFFEETAHAKSLKDACKAGREGGRAVGEKAKYLGGAYGAWRALGNSLAMDALASTSLYVMAGVNPAGYVLANYLLATAGGAVLGSVATKVAAPLIGGAVGSALYGADRLCHAIKGGSQQPAPAPAKP